MNGWEALTLLLQGLVPLALIGSAARAHASRASWALDLAVAASWLTAIALAGLWLALPLSTVLGYTVLMIGAAALGARPRASKPHRRLPPAAARAGLWARVVVLMALVGTSAYALTGRALSRAEAGRRDRVGSTWSSSSVAVPSCWWLRVRTRKNRSGGRGSAIRGRRPSDTGVPSCRSSRRCNPEIRYVEGSRLRYPSRRSWPTPSLWASTTSGLSSPPSPTASG